MKKEIDHIEVGERVRYIREQVAHLNQKEFAELINAGSESTMSRIETGLQAVDVATLRNIALAGGVTADWILSGNGATPISTHTIKEKEGVKDFIMFDDNWLGNRYGINGDDVLLVGCSTGSCHPTIHKRDIVVVNTKCKDFKDDGYYAVRNQDQTMLRRILPLCNAMIRIYVGASDISYYDMNIDEYQSQYTVLGKAIMVVRQI